jgi:hypothetical protein
MAAGHADPVNEKGRDVEPAQQGIDNIYEAYTLLASGVIGTLWRCSAHRFRWAADAIIDTWRA